MQKRIVLDTNILLSAFLGKNSIKKNLETFVWKDLFLFCYSTELIEEYYDVFSRKKFQGKINLESANHFLEAFKIVGHEVIVSEEVSICRDENDNFILSLCKSCEADFLITGDNDLLTIGHFHKTKILRLADFCIQNGLISPIT